MNQPPVSDDPVDNADLRRARELLPWFVHGQLDSHDQAFMTHWLENTMPQHAAVASRWQLELAAEQAWLLSTRAHLQTAAQHQAAQQADPAIEAQGLAALMQRIAQSREGATTGADIAGNTSLTAITNIAEKLINATSEVRNGHSNADYPDVRRIKQSAPSWQDRISAWLNSTVGIRSPAMAFSVAAVVLVQAGVIGALLLTSPAEQALLSAEPPAAAPNTAAANQVLLKVAFNPQTTELAMRQLLAANGAQILSGPSALGLYTVVVPSANAEAALIALRAAKGVVESVQQ